MSNSTILVTGATGTQGGAVTRALLRRGKTVVAFVRDPSSPSARTLGALGVRLQPGDHDDARSIEAALEGVEAVFLVEVPDPELRVEIEQAERWLAALAQRPVLHLVYSSIANADRGTGIPHFEVRRTIEDRVRNGPVPWTIVAPVYLMENNTTDFALAQLRLGHVTRFVDVDRPVAQVAADDIAECVAAIVERRASMFGRRIDVASDEVSSRTIAAALGDQLGVALTPVRADPAMLDGGTPMERSLAAMVRWLDAEGFAVDRAALRREFPEVPWQPFSAWAARQTWPDLQNLRHRTD